MDPKSDGQQVELAVEAVRNSHETADSISRHGEHTTEANADQPPGFSTGSMQESKPRMDLQTGRAIGRGLSREEVIRQIELLAAQFVESAADGKLLDLETLRRRSDAMAYDGKQMVHTNETRAIRLNRVGARKFTAVWLILQSVYELLREDKTVTQREIYYMHPFFRNQSEADEAILDVGSILRVPRGSINIVGATKGCFTGCLSIKKGDVWNNYDTGDEFPITQQLLQAKSAEIASNAHYILVVEKDGIFNRLREDAFTSMVPSILITGRGFPDLATRCFVSLLSTELKIPVMGLSDCNPFGLSIMLTYRLGSARMPLDTHGCGVDIRWVGLRPSCIPELKLPVTAFKSLASKDLRTAQSLVQSPFVQSQSSYVDEVEKWISGAMPWKIELEALHLLGFDFLSNYVAASITNGYYI